MPFFTSAQPRASVTTVPELPRISAFYGIVIAMYYDDHPPPHFHAKYAGYQAQIVIATGEVYRSPRMHGLPGHTVGCDVIRSSNDTPSAYERTPDRERLFGAGRGMP